jgi:surface antigen
MKSSHVVMIAGLVLGLGVTKPAQAQVNLFGNYAGPVLSKSDYKVGNAAAMRLLNAPPAVGLFQHWRNPLTGNSGMLTILGLSTSAENLPCRKVKSVVDYAKQGSAARAYTLDVCKQSDGKWKVLS